MNGPDSDSEQKKWGQKRQQLDAAVSTARFNGAVEGLIQGTTDVRSLIGILDELNNMQSQRGRYMTEILALKVESRRLLTAPFNERVAEFLIEGARRIPWLSDGLASQFAVALGSAADNPAYLETVNTAVGNLLLDVTRPLKPDTRNYLRALTDKIVASRRLQEARGHLAIVPSVYPSAIPQHLAEPVSPELAPTLIAQPPERAMVVPHVPSEAVSDPPIGGAGTVPTTLKMGATEPVSIASSAERVEAAAEGQLQRPAVYPPVPGREPGGFDTAQASVSHAASARDALPQQPSIPAGKTTPGLGASIAKKDTDDRRSSSRQHAATDIASRERGLADPGFAAVPAVKSVPPSATENDDDWADLDQDELQADQVRQGRRRGIPIWIVVVAAGAVVAAGVAVWLLTRDAAEPRPSATAGASAAASASAKAPAKASGKPAAAAPSQKASAPTTSAPPPAPTPPPAPAASNPYPPAAMPAPASPKTVAPPRTSPPVAPPPVVPRTTPAPIASTARPSRSTAPSGPSTVATSEPPPVKAQPAKPPIEKPAPKLSAEPPSESPPATPRTPAVSRTIDDIIVELLRVPNDVASIEAKAHEVARIVARSSRNDAEIILRRLIPEEVLAGTETVDTRALEPVRRVVALLLKKVALDKDDQRAALAIETLGEWAKLRKHGAAAKMTLDELAEDRVVLSRPKRMQALERVQARLGIPNTGE